MALPKTLLIILDGFGEGKDYPFNAVTRSKMPFFNEAKKKFPHSQLLTCGEAVGLPKGIMGNSEVGHMNIGAGRIVYQELSRIDRAIRGEGERFEENPAILDLLKKISAQKSRLHLFCLVSDAGVHSHFNHLLATLELVKKYSEKVSQEIPVLIHFFSDGRDTPPRSGQGFAKTLTESFAQYPNAKIASLSGRYYAMDRDNRWERVEKAWKALTGGAPLQTLSVDEIFSRSYANEITDEFIEPVAFDLKTMPPFVQNKDGVFFLNFRSDRARQLTRAFTQPDFKEFDVRNRPQLSGFVCMTEYDKSFGLPVAFSPQNLSQILPDLLEAHHLTQFRIAETEKYAHVTFFFNGSREAPYQGEARSLIASPRDVPTYDLKPEMSAEEVTNQLVSHLENQHEDFILVNYANADMVGHTGNFDAALKALEFLDRCLARVFQAALKNGYTILLTADHGNAEEMHEHGDHEQAHTQHTMNPVPFLLCGSATLTHGLKLRESGVLADVAPTILELMNLPKPAVMTGTSLILHSSPRKSP